MSDQGRALVRPLAVAAAAAGAVGYLAAVDPNRPGHYPGCPILALTGFFCPGCGGLRAVHDLTRADVAGALSSNLVVTLAVPVVVGLWFRWFLRARGAAGTRATSTSASTLRTAATSSADPAATSRNDTPGPDPKGRLRAGIRVWGPPALLFGLILFAVLRNLPGLEYLAP
ncbi:DUF2752 domain-containing protein [Kineosporia succinea]|uniref:DUF2752 domain-containing protein n=1 Tax=Kineosporia succinea TaxID=84632 RepID=A0ABT9PGP5_9ACTN|nr:DUF2752 domain-containing protein [Kineosporia succinea]MDP9831315.1 hypothetical protein [Kineosporia succinea]